MDPRVLINHNEIINVTVYLIIIRYNKVITKSFRYLVPINNMLCIGTKYLKYVESISSNQAIVFILWGRVQSLDLSHFTSERMLEKEKRVYNLLDIIYTIIISDDICIYLLAFAFSSACVYALCFRTTESNKCPYKGFNIYLYRNLYKSL